LEQVGRIQNIFQRPGQFAGTVEAGEGVRGETNQGGREREREREREIGGLV
jgi:hypothetical protein